MAVRFSTLAEVKILSLTSLILRPGVLNGSKPIDYRVVQGDINNFKDKLEGYVQNKFTGNERDGTDIFSTVGLAQNIRIDEDYGTQNYYGIGSPLRPRIVPNNYSVNVSVDRLTTDRRTITGSYMTSPEFFYSPTVQRLIGVNDWLLYSYIYVRDKETPDGVFSTKVYAIMPRSESKPITTGNAVIVDSVQCIGFAYTLPQIAEEILENLLEFDLTTIAND